MRDVTILGIAGSLREGSYNRALLDTAAELAPDGVAFDMFDLAPIPFYNADVEATGDPDPVATFKRRIDAADGVLIATPEYPSERFEDGRLVDEDGRKFLSELLGNLVARIRGA